MSVATSSSRPSCLTANSSALVSASSAFLSASFSSSPVRRFSSFISTMARENFSCRESGIEPLYWRLRSWMICREEILPTS